MNFDPVSKCSKEARSRGPKWVWNKLCSTFSCLNQKFHSINDRKKWSKVHSKPILFHVTLPPSNTLLDQCSDPRVLVQALSCHFSSKVWRKNIGGTYSGLKITGFSFGAYFWNTGLQAGFLKH